jgi:predicted alpha/beta-hydrolase family hydrolase
MTAAPQRLTIECAGGPLSALWLSPAGASACLVLAHGAGAGMEHVFMNDLAQALAEVGVSTLRFNFPSLERGSRRPDPPEVAHDAVRAAVHRAHALAPGLPLAAGGKSFGGRMTSQAFARGLIPQAGALVFVGFPLHPPKKPGVERAQHLRDVHTPMLFVQGTRDALAQAALIEGVCAELGERARLCFIEGADHGFAAPRSAQRDGVPIVSRIARLVAGFLDE